MKLELPPLPNSTILVVEVGSTAHGTGIPGGEDLDLSAIYVEMPDEVFGLGRDGARTVMQRTQPEGAKSGPGDIDRTLFSLRKFLHLASKGNPSVLQCLWAPVREHTTTGIALRASAPLFVGRHIVPRYRGYMRSQAERLVGARSGKARREDLISEFGYDTKAAMHALRLSIQCRELLSEGEISFPMQEENRSLLADVRAGRVDFDTVWDALMDGDAELARLADDESVRPGPDAGGITQFSIAAHQLTWDTAAR